MPCRLRLRFALAALEAAVASALAAAAPPRSYLVEAEDLVAAPFRAGRGYAFADVSRTPGGWVSVSAKSPLVTGDPLVLTIPDGLLPADRYRVAYRTARWKATEAQNPVPGFLVQMGDSPEWRHTFARPADRSWFIRGGVYRGNEHWRWIEMEDPLSVKFPLTVTIRADPSPPGDGNYRGIVLDALRFTPVDRGFPCPEGWSGDAVATSHSTAPEWQGIMLRAIGGRTVRAACETRAPPGPDANLIFWVQTQRPLGEARLGLLPQNNDEWVWHDLNERAGAVQLSVGEWYLVTVPVPAGGFRRVRFEIAPSLGFSSEVRVYVTQPAVVDADRLDALLTRRSDASLPVLVRQELAVSRDLRRFVPGPVTADKKLIVWGSWYGAPGGCVDTSRIRRHLDRMKATGADGFVLSALPVVNGKSVYFADAFLTPDVITWEHFEQARRDMEGVDLGPLTEVLLRLDVVGTPIDWFSEEHWRIVAEKARVAARLARMWKLRGILLDTEQYPPRPPQFRYGEGLNKTDRPFREVADQLYRRGRELMQAWQDEHPGLTVLFTHGNTGLVHWKAEEPGPDRTHGLLIPAFIDGLLSVDGPVVVDGYERSYYANELRDFLVGRWEQDRAALYSRDPQRYRDRLQKGFAVWLTRGHWEPERPETCGHTPRKFERVLHHALKCADKYVWVYHPPANFWTGEKLTPSYERTLKTARTAAAGTERGNDMEQNVPTFLAASCSADADGTTRGKRVIVFGGHVGPTFFAANREKLGSLPVTGVVMTLWPKRDGKGVYLPDDLFKGPAYGPDPFREDIAALESVRGFMPDTLMRFNVGHRIDWFDDEHWTVVLTKARQVSEVVARGGLRGYCLDTEQYVTKPYTYPLQEHAGRYSFAEYQAQVRKRGRQLMENMTVDKSDVTVMYTFTHSAVAEQVAGGLPLSRAAFGLLPAFIDGMMEAGPEAEFVDGYEQAYPYAEHAEFAEGARRIRAAGKAVSLLPELYAQKMKVGFGIWPIGKEIVKDEPYVLTADDLEHALHYALRESDGLVWLYMGGLRRWCDRLPDEYAEALGNAWKPHKTGRRRSRERKPAGVYVARARGRAEVKDEVAFAHLAGKYREILDLPLEWRFRLDPDDVGERGQWFAEGADDRDWGTIEIREWWQPQGHLTCGLAWYRVTVPVPPAETTDGWILAFGAVDEQAWVWVNGQVAGKHAFGPEGWQSPFELDVSRLIRPGRENQITVRVHDSLGVGGIWKGVKLMAPQ